MTPTDIQGWIDFAPYALVALLLVIAAAYLLESTDRGRRLMDALDARVDPPVVWRDPLDEPGDWRS